MAAASRDTPPTPRLDAESEEDAPSEDASSLSGEITPAPKQGGLLSRFFGERSLDGPRVEDLAAASCRPPTPEPAAAARQPFFLISPGGRRIAGIRCQVSGIRHQISGIGIRY